MASTLPLHAPLPAAFRRPHRHKSALPLIPSRRNPNLRFSPISASTSESWEREEARWLREEQRWLREEQRWLREEQRWAREESRWRAERDALLREIAALRLRVQALERQRPSIEVSIRTAPHPEVADGGSAQPALAEESEVKEVVKEVKVSSEEEKKKKRRKMLRMGAEGDDVRAMQVWALHFTLDDLRRGNSL